MSSWSGLGAGFKDSACWVVTSYHVEFSLPAALVVVVSAVSASVSQPCSLFTAFNRPPSPRFGSQPCLYWIAQSHLVGSKGMSLKNNQTLPRGSEWGRARMAQVQ